MDLKNSPASRRSFLTGGPAAAAASTFMLVKPQLVRGWAPAKLKVGLVGCGGRGTQAVLDMFNGDEATELVAMGDAFEDRLEGSLRRLRGNPKFADRVKVDPDKRFTGFDSYKKVINSGADVIFLATPPGWRPIHFEAAIDAGKHVFCEKPFATDCAGMQRFMAAARKSIEKKLTVVSGAQRRSDPAYLSKIEEFRAGKHGKVLAMYAYWVGRPVIHPVPQTLTTNDFDFQHRRWYSYVWLCGDQIVEQHLHNIDSCNWVMDAHPVKAVAMGGANFRPTRDQQSNIFDHCAVDFEYADGTRMSSYCRQYPEPCSQNVSELIVTTNGRIRLDQTRGGPGYVAEHTKLYKSIRGDGPYINESMVVAESTLTCIMGREAAYSGQEVTWDDVMNSTQDLSPKPDTWDYKAKFAPTPMPIPGVYKFKNA